VFTRPPFGELVGREIKIVSTPVCSKGLTPPTASFMEREQMPPLPLFYVPGKLPQKSVSREY
jgi:hypothetical protein